MENHLVVFDKAGLMARVGNDIEFFRELLELFFSSYESTIASLKEACTEGNGKRIESEAHSIKSALGNLGAVAAHAQARSLERLGATNHPEDAVACLRDLEAAIQDYRLEVSEYL